MKFKLLLIYLFLSTTGALSTTGVINLNLMSGNWTIWHMWPWVTKIHSSPMSLRNVWWSRTFRLSFDRFCHRDSLGLKHLDLNLVSIVTALLWNPQHRNKTHFRGTEICRSVCRKQRCLSVGTPNWKVFQRISHWGLLTLIYRLGLDTS